MARISALLLLLFFTAPLFARGAEGFDEVWERGYAEHSAGEYGKSVVTFQRCLELRPSHFGSAYNIACGYSCLKELDRAFEWLEKAVEWGFGMTDVNYKLVVSQDTDMANARADSRFDAIVKRMRDIRDRVEDEWKVAAMHLSPDLEKAAEGGAALGVLIVLHDAGKTKLQTLNAWKEHADELGVALLAPSGKFPGPSIKPVDGMFWFADIADYKSRYWTYETSIDLALDTFKEKYSLDKQRVLIAGVGQGAVVAFSQAIRAPALYHGVLIDSGPVILDTIDTRKRKQAVEAGLMVRTIASKQGAWGIPADSFEKRLEAIGNTLARWKLGAPYVYYDPATPGERERYRRVALSTLLPAQEAVEAGGTH